MSQKTTGWVSAVLALVLLLSCYMLGLEHRKTSENLPALETLLQMDDAKIDSRISGYTEYQLIENWGKPSRSDTETMVWRLPEGVVTVQADRKGRVISCSGKRTGDLPLLDEFAHMEEYEINTWLLGRFADQVAAVWERPDSMGRKLFTWDLPPDSPHMAVTVEVNQWGMIQNAQFND